MNNLIVKDNALINASYNLDLTEQRLILLAIMEARESGKGITANDPLEIHADSYIHQFSVHRNAAYKALKKACDDLFKRQFSYQTINTKNNIQNHKSRWVSEIIYVDNEAIVKIIFAPAVVPLITRLEQQFTKYDIQQISNLTSAYAIRLYELLISWRSTGKTPVFSIEDFRGKLGVNDTDYSIISDLKKRVLDIAIQQINQHTDILVKYDQHKNGRNIVGFSFSFRQKGKKKIISSSNNVIKMTDSQRHLFANKLSKLPEMSTYSRGTEGYDEFSIRIAEMLEDIKNIEKFLPLLKKLGWNC